MARLKCRQCGDVDSARSIERLYGTCDIDGVDDDGEPEFCGYTDMDWDSSTSVKFACANCDAEVTASNGLAALFEPYNEDEDEDDE